MLRGLHRVLEDSTSVPRDVHPDGAIVRSVDGDGLAIGVRDSDEGVSDADHAGEVDGSCSSVSVVLLHGVYLRSG